MDDSAMDDSGESSTTTLKRSTAASTKERRLRLEKVGSYRVGRILGKGNFACVRSAYHEVANAKVAMKIVDRRNLDSENMVKIEREIEVLQTLSHPYIVRLHEVIRTEKFLYIITEYVSNGELFDMLMDRGRQPEEEARRLFQQIVSAVAYCHARGIVHRDLKAENLLLDRQGNVKLIDFGFSNRQPPNELLSTWCGSPPYAAPELLLAQAYDGRLSDVWSLGVILYILVTAGFPFPGDSVDKLKRAVINDGLKIPFWVSVECADLIRKMLTVLPIKRISLGAVVQHRWFTASMPDHIAELLHTDTLHSHFHSHSQSQLSLRQLIGVREQLDPTIMIFLQQHTGWGEEQIAEEVLSRNYESPIFGTYELLRAKLEEFRDGDSLQLTDANDQARRGSRGSILSGKVGNAEAESTGATIPAHHLAKLSLSASPDYDSDSSASDIASASDDLLPSSSNCFPRYQPHPQPQQQQKSGGVYKCSRRRIRARREVSAAGEHTNRERRQTLAATDHVGAFES